jgi:hypothetical protein
MELPAVPHMAHDGMDNSSVYKYNVQTKTVSETLDTNSTLTRLIWPTTLHCKSVKFLIHILLSVKLNMS